MEVPDPRQVYIPFQSLRAVLCSGQLSLLPLVGQEISSSVRVMRWRPSGVVWCYFCRWMQLSVSTGNVAALSMFCRSISSCQSAATSEIRFQVVWAALEQVPSDSEGTNLISEVAADWHELMERQNIMTKALRLCREQLYFFSTSCILHLTVTAQTLNITFVT